VLRITGLQNLYLCGDKISDGHFLFTNTGEHIRNKPFFLTGVDTVHVFFAKRKGELPLMNGCRDVKAWANFCVRKLRHIAE